MLFTILSALQQFRSNLDMPVPGFSIQAMAVKVLKEAKALGQFTNVLIERERTGVSSISFHFFYPLFKLLT